MKKKYRTMTPRGKVKFQVALCRFPEVKLIASLLVVCADDKEAPED